jgi:hypothetical protein
MFWGYTRTLYFLPITIYNSSQTKSIIYLIAITNGNKQDCNTLV